MFANFGPGRCLVLALVMVLMFAGNKLPVSGVVHNYLYIRGYNDIPTVGPAFLLQASMFCALAVLILAGALLSVGTLNVFALSRGPRPCAGLPSAAAPEPMWRRSGQPRAAGGF